MSIYLTFAGFLAADPENGITPNGAENIKFRVVVNEKRGQTETVTWLSIAAWGSTAKGLTTLAQRGLLAKGARVLVNGTMASREYTDRNDVNRTSLDVTAANVELIAPPKDYVEGQPSNDYAAASAPF